MSEPRECPRCGSDMAWVDCESCVDGFSRHDCGEDTCCCVDPENNVTCDICDGETGWWSCFHRPCATRFAPHPDGQGVG